MDREQLLHELRGLRKEQDQHAQREEDLVKRARRMRMTWEEIAKALGRNRSAVWKKYNQVCD